MSAETADAVSVKELLVQPTITRARLEKLVEDIRRQAHADVLALREKVGRTPEEEAALHVSAGGWAAVGALLQQAFPTFAPRPEENDAPPTAPAQLAANVQCLAQVATLTGEAAALKEKLKDAEGWVETVRQALAAMDFPASDSREAMGSLRRVLHAHGSLQAAVVEVVAAFDAMPPVVLPPAKWEALARLKPVAEAAKTRWVEAALFDEQWARHPRLMDEERWRRVSGYLRAGGGWTTLEAWRAQAVELASHLLALEAHPDVLKARRHDEALARMEDVACLQGAYGGQGSHEAGLAAVARWVVTGTPRHLKAAGEVEGRAALAEGAKAGVPHAQGGAGTQDLDARRVQAWLAQHAEVLRTNAAGIPLTRASGRLDVLEAFARDFGLALPPLQLLSHQDNAETGTSGKSPKVLWEGVFQDKPLRGMGDGGLQWATASGEWQDFARTLTDMERYLVDMLVTTHRHLEEEQANTTALTEVLAAAAPLRTLHQKMVDLRDVWGTTYTQIRRFLKACDAACARDIRRAVRPQSLRPHLVGLEALLRLAVRQHHPATTNDGRVVAALMAGTKAVQSLYALAGVEYPSRLKDLPVPRAVTLRRLETALRWAFSPTSGPAQDALARLRGWLGMEEGEGAALAQDDMPRARVVQVLAKAVRLNRQHAQHHAAHGARFNAECFSERVAAVEAAAAELGISARELEHTEAVQVPTKQEAGLTVAWEAEGVRVVETAKGTAGLVRDGGDMRSDREISHILAQGMVDMKRKLDGRDSFDASTRREVQRVLLRVGVVPKEGRPLEVAVEAGLLSAGHIMREACKAKVQGAAEAIIDGRDTDGTERRAELAAHLSRVAVAAMDALPLPGAEVSKS